jgi:hypothetical protein
LPRDCGTVQKDSQIMTIPLKGILWTKTGCRGREKNIMIMITNFFWGLQFQPQL